MHAHWGECESKGERSEQEKQKRIQWKTQPIEADERTGDQQALLSWATLGEVGNYSTGVLPATVDYMFASLTVTLMGLGAVFAMTLPFNYALYPIIEREHDWKRRAAVKLVSFFNRRRLIIEWGSIQALHRHQTQFELPHYYHCPLFTIVPTPSTSPSSLLCKLSLFFLLPSSLISL